MCWRRPQVSWCSTTVHERAGGQAARCVESTKAFIRWNDGGADKGAVAHTEPDEVAADGL